MRCHHRGSSHQCQSISSFLNFKGLDWNKKIFDSLFQEICPVHSTILPKTHWSYFSTPEELDELIETLNVRGIREHELREKLVHDREKIVRVLKKASGIAPKLSVDDEDLAKVEKMETKKVGWTCSCNCLELREACHFVFYWSRNHPFSRTRRRYFC